MAICKWRIPRNVPGESLLRHESLQAGRNSGRAPRAFSCFFSYFVLPFFEFLEIFLELFWFQKLVTEKWAANLRRLFLRGRFWVPKLFQLFSPVWSPTSGKNKFRARIRCRILHPLDRGSPNAPQKESRRPRGSLECLRRSQRRRLPCGGGLGAAWIQGCLAARPHVETGARLPVWAERPPTRKTASRRLGNAAARVRAAL